MATTFVERLEGSYRESICNFLSKAGEAAPYIAPYAMWAGPYGKALSIGLGVANLAARTQCGWDPDKPSEIGGGVNYVEPGSCMETVGCDLFSVDVNGSQFAGYQNKKLFGFGPAPNAPNGQTMFKYSRVECDGTVVTVEQSTSRLPIRTWVGEGGQCAGDPAPDTGTPPTIPPYTYTDEDSGCTLIVETLGFGEGIDGNINPIVQISPGPETRENGGGRIGGCNFQPVIYYNENEGTGCCPPIPPIPVPPNPPDGPDGEPWWLDLLKKAGATAAGNLAAAAIRSFFEPVLPIASFTLIAPCDKDEQENPLEVKYALPIQNYQSRVLSQQAVIMEILQQHLNWKTPVCFPKDESGLYFRSISFESETYSPNSNARLVKRFRYRSNSPGDVRQLATHWAVFEWNTGPVIVRHRGSALGSPQVWASSVDEGKRVIQHAGAEAGVDPNQVGEWSIGGSDNPRYGVSATVKLKCVDGCWAATARQGPSGWPEAAY